MNIMLKFMFFREQSGTLRDSATLHCATLYYRHNYYGTLHYTSHHTSSRLHYSIVLLDGQNSGHISKKIGFTDQSNKMPCLSARSFRSNFLSRRCLRLFS